MSDHTRRRTPRHALATGAFAGLAAAAMIAGCGSSSPTSPGSVGHATQAQAQGQLQQDLVRFADCMRSRRVSGFPDPTAPGAAKECQWPSVSPHPRPLFLPTGGHLFSPLVATNLPTDRGVSERVRPRA